MDVEKILRRVKANPSNLRELRRVSRELADELPRQDLQVLREFRAALARLSLPGVEAEARGYLLALMDLTAGYEAWLEPRLEEEQLAQLALKEGWKPLLRLLQQQGVVLSGELARQAGQDPGYTSRRLQEMREAGVVEVYAFEGGDARQKPYRLTARGRRMAERLGVGARAARAGAPLAASYT